MTFVVTDNCIKCKHTDCVEVCPVDCFHEGANMLVIDPEECIDCSLCEPECPVQAIFAEDDLPDGQRHFLDINREFAGQWPVLSEQHPAPPDAERWNGVEGKYPEHFDPRPADPAANPGPGQESTLDHSGGHDHEPIDV